MEDIFDNITSLLLVAQNRRAAGTRHPFDALAFLQKEEDVVNAASAIFGGHKVPHDVQLLHILKKSVTFFRLFKTGGFRRNLAFLLPGFSFTETKKSGWF